MVMVLKASKREATRKYANVALRRTGCTPCVIYGKGEDSTPISIQTSDLTRFVNSGDLVVRVELNGETKDAVIKEVQYNTFMTSIVHADFNILHADQETSVTVPIEIKGTPAGAAQGGIISIELHEIDVICLPRDIPSKVVMDVRDLQLNHRLTVRDLPVTGSMRFDLPGETPVVSCHLPKGPEEAKTSPLEGITAVEPEVIGKKKEDEEGGDKPEKK